MNTIKIWCSLRFGIAILAVVWMAGCTSVGGSGQAELLTSSDLTVAQRRASIRLQLAVGYYEQKQMSTALDEIKQALVIYPEYSDAYTVRGMIYMAMGEMPLAEDNFKRAMSLAPHNPELSNNYGWFLCQNGQEAKSIPYFEVAIKSHTYQSPAKALNNAGVCSLKLKDGKAAEQYFTRAFKFDPSSPETNINFAKMYYERKEYDRAYFYVSRVTKPESMSADFLWLAIKLGRKRGDREAESTHVAQLRRKFPNSVEYATYQRGAFDE